MRALGVVAALVLATAAVVTCAPLPLGLSTTPGVTQAVALRGAGALALLVLGLVIGLAAAAVALRRRRRPLVAGALAVVLLACAAGHVGVLVARGWDGGGAAPAPDLVVVALNTEVDGVAPEELAALVEGSGADVVALPETSERTAEAVAAAVERRTGEAFAVLAEEVDDRPIAATSLLVHERLGPHERADAPALDLSAVAAAPVDGDGPLLVAVHPPPPIPGAFPQERWAEQVATAAAACTAAPGAVVAGDLNATLDHAPLADALDAGPCVDTADAVGAAAWGTWPASVPAVLGAPIDHVLVDGRVWQPLSARVERVGATDHRALVVALARREP
ncbi:endonuclease/exonuclease/phosphatase family protein [Pseudokineococcus marinus]|uniref:Endonuclease/exonuclease/phosphatase family protein n=1 Tax=Pseudokineococcus marinus TaxID=351215 RepID=A0A849BS64_9ACTN|nr:endonuclease/exonuclease/phosphatase family protein [Pseudokineococcus marinus]NNH24253.1 endonuclease/exonuclease/phosphatase family protein [Pseudokineococcus marinus]